LNHQLEMKEDGIPKIEDFTFSEYCHSVSTCKFKSITENENDHDIYFHTCPYINSSYPEDFLKEFSHNSTLNSEGDQSDPEIIDN
jgi:hypothetical protein